METLMRLLSLLSLSFLIGCPGDTGGKDSVPTDDSTTTDDSQVVDTDADDDGVSDEEDCAPNDATIYPGATEICDGLDQNCDDQADEGLTSTYYQDADNDGFGNEDMAKDLCEAETGWTAQGGDCDDLNAAYNPNASENDCADPNDYNCDGSVGFADADQDGVAACNDCDDANAAVNPSAMEMCNGYDDNCDGNVDGDAMDAATYYTDGDTDGYGDDSTGVTACEQPTGTSALGGDCDDNNTAYNPGASETDCADPNDYNCDGSTGYSDNDGDGFAACLECDDRNNTINPNGTEECDGVDNNCDGAVDEDTAVDASMWYADADNDSYGDANSMWMACNQPSGYTADWSDCNDADGAISPGAAEACNGYDDNCDGNVDDNTTGSPTWYADRDMDSYGDPNDSVQACTAPELYVADGTDCTDIDPSTYPGAVEYCDNWDNDCDGLVDDGAYDTLTYYADSDNDSFGDPNVTVIDCFAPSGYVYDWDDCNDGDSAINPNATELCDGIDNNCDGNTDESSAADAAMWYMDMDEDGYGDPAAMTMNCTQPIGYVSDWTDCNDNADAVYPGAIESCNGTDDNCDGTTDENSAVDASTWYADSDNDGYGNPSNTATACSAPFGYVADSSDCNDRSRSINPGASEYCNGVDDDCDNSMDENSAVDAAIWYRDLDGDTYGDPTFSGPSCTQPSGAVSNSSDCNDNNNAIRPGATEYCDSVDNNCDGTTDEDTAADAPMWYQDSDNDQYGNPLRGRNACNQPSGSVSNNSDCDDSSSAVNPGATETCNSVDDNCDGSIDPATSSGAPTWYLDNDQDGYGNASRSTVACSAPAFSVADSTDCNDNSATISPAGQEVCDSANTDEDCDGLADNNDSSATGTTAFYADADADSYASMSATMMLCNASTAYPSATMGTDCNDASNTTYPGATETCNSIDDNCDGTADNGALQTYYQDADGDGFGNASISTTAACLSAPVGYRLDSTDCNDADVNIQPYAYDLATDAIDSDCNGATTGRVTYTNATVGDDSSTTVTASSSFRFPLCGTNYSTFYMISNGRITMGASDTDYSETLAELTADTAIMPYWDDMYTSVAGQMQYAQFSDAIAFYWIGVSECCSTSATVNNSFSAVLFNDGTVLYTYGTNTLTGKDAIVGYACTPTTTPTEMNLSAISYPTGYWGYGTGTERAVVEQFSSASSDPFDLGNNSALRLCANPSNSGLTHCAE